MRERLSPEDRERFASERRAYENKLVIGGECDGYLILHHIRGSQFKASNGVEDVYVSQRSKEAIQENFILGGFVLWK